ncbi:serine protein kinase RIO [Methanopyrus sp. KOL6]|uniref:serine protein kinase RIO n=1 Tax=Methanopyrus sp. KOL6 TaxID=1937004 RepID=UPI0018DF4B4B|nr:serine protein kinase RIO [Methanopyrus sp. KOL6]
MTEDKYFSAIEELEPKPGKVKRLEKTLEDLKVEEEVFDQYTLMTLYELSRRGYIDGLMGFVKTGKEANVVRGIRGDELVAVKIYRVATSDFRRMWRYIRGDPRFENIGRKRHRIVYAWAEKEFKNLTRAYGAGVRCPEPIAHLNNVLIMKFIGDDEGNPYPLMKDNPPEEEYAEDVFSNILDDYRRMYRKAEIVHGDLSEYNILYRGEGDYVIIDFSQGVVLDHPIAEELLIRDLRNLIRFFERLRVDTPTLEEVLEYVRG